MRIKKKEYEELQEQINQLIKPTPIDDETKNIFINKLNERINSKESKKHKK